MLHVIILFAVMTSCFGQDSLTCLRTSDTFQLSSTVGQKGEKGDRGDDYVVAEPKPKIRLEIRRLKEQVEALKQSVVKFREDVLIERGWYKGSNGYFYKVTTDGNTWHRCRQICRDQGGDLAVEAIRNVSLRAEISAGLQFYERAWIGLSDWESEGEFKWVDGTYSTAENTPYLWNKASNGPDGGRAENCVEFFNVRSLNELNDRACETGVLCMCEQKPVKVD